MKKILFTILALVSISFSMPTYVRLIQCKSVYLQNSVVYEGLYRDQNGNSYRFRFNNNCPIRYSFED